MSPADAEEFFVYQYLIEAAPSVDRRHEAASLMCVGSDTKESPFVVEDVLSDEGQRSSDSLLPDQLRPTLHADSALQQKVPRKLRILYLAKFRGAESMPRVVRAFRAVGHNVDALDERSIESPGALVELINHRTYDCLMFFEGRINPRTERERHFPTGEGIAHVLRSVKIPGYTWYFDKVYDFDFNRSREPWMQKVAPLCRVAFVTDGALARHTDWGNWYVLRQGVSSEDVCPVEIPEDERRDVAFLGSIYGERAKELEPVAASLELDIISNAFGQELSRVLRSYKIVLGPRYPSVPYYWSVRLYTVLGHGGFFLAPEIEGMREEGFVPGVHYAALGDDPVADIRSWLARPAERERIARAGQELVLSRFTYKHRVVELTRVIAETLPQCLASDAPTCGGPVATRGKIAVSDETTGRIRQPTQRRPLVEGDADSCADGQRGRAPKARQQVRITANRRGEESAVAAHERLREVENRYFLLTDEKAIQYGEYLVPVNTPGWFSRPYEYCWADKWALPEHSVLDAGCGVEHFFKFYLAGKCRQVEAVDCDKNILSLRHQYENLRFHHLDMSKRMPFQAGVFDVIVCMSVLEHIQSRIPRVLHEFARLLKRDTGRVLITIDAPRMPVERFLALVEESPLVPVGAVERKKPDNALDRGCLTKTRKPDGYSVFRCLLRHGSL